MRRLGDILPDVAADIGIKEELRRSRQMATWQRLVAELVPSAAGDSQLLAVQPPALIARAGSAVVAQELRLRQRELLDGFARAPDGQRLIELRIVVRPAGGARPDARVD